MKKFLSLISIFCVPLLAFVAEEPPQATLTYKNYVIEGKDFKIHCSNGLIIDACHCGCPRDATDILNTWIANATLEIAPYVHDAKGHLFILRNLDNDTEIFTWLRDASVEAQLPTLTQTHHRMPIIQLSNGHYWFFPDHNKCNWTLDDRILISGSYDLADGIYWLINLDQPNQPAREAIFWQSPS